MPWRNCQEAQVFYSSRVLQVRILHPRALENSEPDNAFFSSGVKICCLSTFTPEFSTSQNFFKLVLISSNTFGRTKNVDRRLALLWQNHLEPFGLLIQVHPSGPSLATGPLGSCPLRTTVELCRDMTIGLCTSCSLLPGNCQ